MDVVIDTNCLLRIFSRRSKYYCVWRAFLDGEYTLCVTTEILAEYEEILGTHASPVAANLTVETILCSNNVRRLDARFRFHAIEADPDDNKFVDCAIAANAKYIVSDDHHFDVLRDDTFPFVDVVKLSEFVEIINKGKC